MITVHICLSDIFGVAVACEVIFYPGDTPFFNGAALAVSGARSIRLDAGGNGSVTLLPGHYTVRFLEITGNTDTLHILVPNKEGVYELAELVGGGGEGLKGGLLAFWKLDEDGGVRVDATGNGNDLSSTNGVGYDVELPGAGAWFDGNNYLSTQQNFDPTQSYTMSCFAMATSATGYQGAVMLGPGPTYAVLSPTFENVGGGPCFNPSDVTSLVVIPGLAGDTLPHFLAATYDANTGIGTLHVDGQKTALALNPIVCPPGPLWVGGGPGNFLTGWVANVGLWNRVLLDAEIAQLYNNGNGLAYPFA